MKSTLRTLCACLILLIGAGDVLAGANETPGRRRRPHRFAGFAANMFEFGYSDFMAFNIYVVGEQHYRTGAFFADTGRDNSHGGGGLMNFKAFVSANKYDVMLTTAHGEDNKWPEVGGTSVEIFPCHPENAVADSLAEKARDDAMEGYLETFTENEIKAVDTDHYYSIMVTQNFYNNHMRTPKAMVWWATCYSSQMMFTGACNARVQLGYDNMVVNKKCKCDEHYILSRMDGQFGQVYRPLNAAMWGVNGECPPNDASLVVEGKKNTVLSPSVLDNKPTGIVCGPVPGYVKFDTTMDTAIPPQVVVRAEGDAYLTGHAWNGDDRVDFIVMPTTQYPNIKYVVKESAARSLANRARLDGNTWPGPRNAYGPNRDDYIWNTTCPGNPAQPSTPSTPSNPKPATPTTPGGTTRVRTPITNGGTPKTTTVTLTEALGWIENPDTTFFMSTDTTEEIDWDFHVPEDAEPGTTNHFTVTVEGEGAPCVATGEIVVPSLVEAALHDNPALVPGQVAEKLIMIESIRGADTEVTNLAFNAPADLVVTPLETGFTLPAEADFDLNALFELAPVIEDSVFAVAVTADLDGVPSELGEFWIVAGLPLVAPGLHVDVPAGSQGYPILLPVENVCAVPLDIQVQAVDSNGWPVAVPPNTPLNPGEEMELPFTLEVPADPVLIGEEGVITLTFADPLLDLTTVGAIYYTVGSALRAEFGLTQMEDVYTGCAGCVFPWHVELRNWSSTLIEGELELLIETGGQLPLLAPIPFMMGPDEVIPFDFMIPELPAAFEPGLYPVQIEATTFGGLGDFTLDTELLVTTPVTASMLYRCESGEAGEEVTVTAVLENHRPDLAMSGDFEWHDSLDWLPEPQLGQFTVAPSIAECLQVVVGIPPGRAALDSTLVTLAISMPDDFGGVQVDTATTWLKVFEQTVAIDDDAPPAESALLGNFPNPFNPKTVVKFNLATAGHVRLTVHDVVGREVAVLQDGRLEAGLHGAVWDGAAVSSGVYFIRLETVEGVWSGKAVMVR